MTTLSPDRDPFDDVAEEDCPGCAGVGVTEAGTCDVCIGSGRVVTQKPPLDPPGTPPTIDIFEGEQIEKTVLLDDGRKPSQEHLFGDPSEAWKDQWKYMPEFNQQDLMPIKTIYVHFEKRQNIYDFAKLIGQTITMQTRSIWYPEAEIGHYAHKRWIDAEPEPLPDDGIETTEIEN